MACGVDVNDIFEVKKTSKTKIGLESKHIHFVRCRWASARLSYLCSELGRDIYGTGSGHILKQSNDSNMKVMVSPRGLKRIKRVMTTKSSSIV